MTVRFVDFDRDCITSPGLRVLASYNWPPGAQKKGKPPIPCRLIRIPAKGSVKNDVWLLTDLLDSTRLSPETAAEFYRWRWRNEGGVSHIQAND
jgi:hypothetical protein